MSKYETWIEPSWKVMNEDFLRGDFKPQTESDIKCHLYHALLQTKPQIKTLEPRHIVLTEYGRRLPRIKRIDLAIGTWDKEKNRFEPRLAIEVKKTRREKFPHNFPFHKIKERVRKDIEKLRRFRKILEEKKEEDILKNFRKPRVIFFFTRAFPDGIPSRIEYGLEKNIQEEYGDIDFMWGPC